MLHPVDIEPRIFVQYLVAVVVITEKMNTCAVGWLRVQQLKQFQL